MSGGMRKRLALAQTLILSPDILLMDEPFLALDVQTRQLMENELLALWAEDRKSVLFITHDLEEAMRSPTGSRAVGRPARGRSATSSRPAAAARRLGDPHDAGLLDLHREIWGVMKEEVLKAYARRRWPEMRLRILQLLVLACWSWPGTG
jgi:NitT/TauT family transport system ATP-binding protein